MKKTLFLLGFFLALAVEAQEIVSQLPFELNAGHIHVKVRVDDAEELTMAFDTGARANLIDQQVAERLGFEVSGKQTVEGASGVISIDLSKGHQISFGNTQFQNEFFFLMDLDRLSDEDHPIDGVIGGTILDQFITEINFEKSEIILYDRASFQAPADHEKQKFSLYPYGIPVLTATLKLKDNTLLTGPYLVDTGAALALSTNYPLVKKHRLSKKLSPNYSYISQNVNSESLDKVGRTPSFELLGREFKDFPLRMSQDKGGVSGSSAVDGILGLELLKRFNLIFDFRSETLYYQANDLLNEPFVENFSGIVVRKVNGQLTVEQVIPASPAEALGINIGDIILSVDGQKEFSKASFYKYIQPLREEVNIEILRGEKTIFLKLKPRKLI